MPDLSYKSDYVSYLSDIETIIERIRWFVSVHAKSDFSHSSDLEPFAELSFALSILVGARKHIYDL